MNRVLSVFAAGVLALGVTACTTTSSDVMSKACLAFEDGQLAVPDILALFNVPPNVVATEATIAKYVSAVCGISQSAALKGVKHSMALPRSKAYLSR